MTIFYSHQDRLGDASGISLLRALVRGAIGRANAVFTRIHQAILTAKTRRIECEPMFHDRPRDDGSLEPEAGENNNAARDAGKFPRQPLILGDKWDF